jgi:ABC-2 type transport system ATP-binding protein
VSNVIEVEGLRKDYRRWRGARIVAVDGLDLAVPPGGVYGFLGPNGAGKTTTIRCLLGLIASSGGSCRLLGADSSTPAALAGVIRRVGTIVEAPTLFPGFSGRRNLELLGSIHGIGRQRIDDTLELVGLTNRAQDRVKTYSLGMKQRLGLGAALLKDPEVLILDEPANGLDPAGIVEVRELLRRLGREGRTVFVSSHILSEVQHICDRVAILARGRCVAAGPVGEVLSGGRATALVVRVDDLGRAADVLRSDGMEARLDGDALRVELSSSEGARVTRVLAERGLYVRELTPEVADLEEVFLQLTKDAPE